VGEALIDIVATEGEENEFAGGSPLNVAITLGRLGDEVSLLTSIGDDARGDEIARVLTESKVILVPESRHPGSTSTARARIGADGSARYAFDIRWDLPASLHVMPSAVIHAGSIALFLQPGASRVSEILARKATDALVTLDPNIRPALLGSHAEALENFESLLVSADLVKLSDEDAAWLYPGLGPGDVLRRLLAVGPSIAAMTRGGESSVLASATAMIEVASVPTTVADTIGAGDSYMGALIHQLLTTDLADRVRDAAGIDSAAMHGIGEFAARVSAITVARRGANPPWLAELLL